MTYSWLKSAKAEVLAAQASQATPVWASQLQQASSAEGEGWSPNRSYG